MPSITYTFHETGAQNVKRQFEEIETRAKAAEKSAKEARRAGGGGTRGGRSKEEIAALEEEKRKTALAKIEARKRAKLEVDAARQANREKASLEKAYYRSKEKARKDDAHAEAAQAKKSADVKRKIERAATVELTNSSKAIARREAEIQKIKAQADRIDRARLEKNVRDQARAEDRRHRDYARHVKRREAASAKQERQAAKQRYKDLVDRGPGLQDYVGGAVGSLAVAGGAAGLAGIGYLAKEGIDRNIKLNEMATRLSINARGKGDAGVPAEELQAEAEATAQQIKGAKAQDVLAGEGAYVARTGDLKEARRYARTFTTASVATGASNEDIAVTGATLRDKFGIDSEAGMQKAFATLIGQGKAGAFEMADMASYVQKMGAAAGRYGMKGEEGVAKLGAISQVARTSTGSGAQAATAVEAMFRQLVAKGADKGKNGIKALTGEDVFTDKSHTKTKDLFEVLPKIIGGAKGDLGKLQKIFDEEGIRAVSGLIQKYNEAADSLGKGAKEADKRAAGEAAVTKALADARGATGDWTEVVKDAATAGTSYAAKMTTASETISSEFGKAMQPLMDAVAGNIKLFTEPLGAAARELGEFTTAIGEITSYVGKKLGLSEEDAKTVENMSAEEAGGKFVQNQATLDALGQKEKKYGRLTGQDAALRGKLNAENAVLAEQIDKKNPQAQIDYKEYLQKHPNATMTEFLAAGGATGLGYEAKAAPAPGQPKKAFWDIAKDTGIGMVKSGALNVATGGAYGLMETTKAGGTLAHMGNGGTITGASAVGAPGLKPSDLEAIASALNSERVAKAGSGMIEMKDSANKLGSSADKLSSAAQKLSEIQPGGSFPFLWSLPAALP